MFLEIWRKENGSVEIIMNKQVTLQFANKDLAMEFLMKVTEGYR